MVSETAVPGLVDRPTVDRLPEAAALELFSPGRRVTAVAFPFHLGGLTSPNAWPTPEWLTATVKVLDGRRPGHRVVDRLVGEPRLGPSVVAQVPATPMPWR